MLKWCQVLATLDVGTSLHAVAPNQRMYDTRRKMTWMARASMPTPQWVDLQVRPQLSQDGHHTVVEFQLVGNGTIFAVRCPELKDISLR